MNANIVYETGMWVLALVSLTLVAYLPTLIEHLAADRSLLPRPTVSLGIAVGGLTLAALLGIIVRG